MRKRAACIVVASLLLLPTCGRGRAPATPAAVPPPPPSSPYPAATRIYADNAGGIQDSLRVVVRDAETLRQLWARATSRESSPQPAPEADFARDMFVLVAAGRLTPDDRIQVENVGLTREMNAAGDMTETLNVTVRTITACRRFNADAYPLEIVRLRRFDGPVKFIERREQAEGCTDADGIGSS